MAKSNSKTKVHNIGDKAIVTFSARADREAFQREIALIGNGNVRLGAIVIKPAVAPELLKKAV